MEAVEAVVVEAAVPVRVRDQARPQPYQTRAPVLDLAPEVVAVEVVAVEVVDPAPWKHLPSARYHHRSRLPRAHHPQR